MKNYLLAILMTLFTNAYAGEHALKAHEHGALKISFAVEKNIVEIDLDGPSESFLGFEYLPKTDLEKKKFQEIKNKWEKEIFDLITFEKKLGCQITSSKLVQIMEEKSTHSDVEASAKITCQMNLPGSTVDISLKRYFKKIKKLKAEILGTKITSVEINKPVQTIKID